MGVEYGRMLDRDSRPHAPREDCRDPAVARTPAPGMPLLTRSVRSTIPIHQLPLLVLEHHRVDALERQRGQFLRLQIYDADAVSVRVRDVELAIREAQAGWFVERRVLVVFLRAEEGRDGAVGQIDRLDL